MDIQPHTIAATTSASRGFAPCSAPMSADIAPSRRTKIRFESPMSSGRLSDTRRIEPLIGDDLAHEPVDVLLGADVEPTARVVEDEDMRSPRQPFGEHDLLLVAARQIAARRVVARARGRAASPSSCFVWSRLRREESNGSPRNDSASRLGKVRFHSTVSLPMTPAMSRSAGT